MAASTPDPARWDIGNPILQPSPVQLTLTLATDPATGQAEIIATIRTSSATVTGTLSAADAMEWRQALTRKLLKMPGPHQLTRGWPGGNGGPLPAGGGT